MNELQKTGVLFIILAWLVVMGFLIILHKSNETSELEKIEVLCLAMANRSVNKVQRKHKYDKEVYDNFKHQFDFECNRMLKMRIGI